MISNSARGTRANLNRFISKRRLMGRRVIRGLTFSLMRDHRLPQLSCISPLRKTLRFSIEDLGRSFSLLKPQYKRQHPPPFTSLLHLYFQRARKSIQPLLFIISPIFITTLVNSSSVHATSHILPIRPQQSLIIDLTHQAYDAFMFPIIECLKYSPITPALTRAEVVPMEFLSQIFATAHYDKVVDRIFFDVFEHKASISMQRFYTLMTAQKPGTLLFIPSSLLCSRFRVVC